MTKYFKMIFINLDANKGYPYGYAIWEDGDAINYLPTKDYTIEWITEQEYIEGCKQVKEYFTQIENKKQVIELKEKIYIRQKIKEDYTELQNELNKLETK